MNTFIETYLQLRFNLVCAARPLLVPCTVGSVSHPSRCRCFDFSKGRWRATVPRAECSVWSRKFSSRLPWEMFWGQRGESCDARTRTRSRGGAAMYDMLTKSDGAGNLLFLCCRTGGAGAWQRSQHWKYRGDLTQLQDSVPTSVLKKKKKKEKEQYCGLGCRENVLYNNV